MPSRIYHNPMKKRSDFEWDSNKDALNQEKHGVSFALAQLAFLDHDRVILEDLEHSNDEKRFELYRQMEEILHEEAPVIPLYYDEVVRFVHKTVEGLEVNAMNQLDLKRVKLNK